MTCRRHAQHRSAAAPLLQAWLLLLLSLSVAHAGETRLTIMSFNLWGGGQNQGESSDATAAVIAAANADIIGLQEVRAESVPCTAMYCPPAGDTISSGLAQALGYHHYHQAASNDALWANAILSRYPIVASSPNDLGVCIDIAGRKVVLFNIHPSDYPYQPYQLLGIPYGAAPFLQTAEQAVRSAHRTRQTALQLLTADLTFAADAELVVLTGDFNEPSHRDWTERAAAAGRHPLAVPWPLTLALEQAGFTDAFRAAHPDELARPGFTWSPLLAAGDSSDHADRIDYVFVRGAQLAVSAARVMGESPDNADIVITPWPSDHRAVLVEVRF